MAFWYIVTDGISTPLIASKKKPGVAGKGAHMGIICQKSERFNLFDLYLHFVYDRRMSTTKEYNMRRATILLLLAIPACLDTNPIDEPIETPTPAEVTPSPTPDYDPGDDGLTIIGTYELQSNGSMRLVMDYTGVLADDEYIGWYERNMNSLVGCDYYWGSEFDDVLGCSGIVNANEVSAGGLGFHETRSDEGILLKWGTCAFGGIFQEAPTDEYDGEPIWGMPCNWDADVPL